MNVAMGQIPRSTERISSFTKTDVSFIKEERLVTIA